MPLRSLVDTNSVNHKNAPNCHNHSEWEGDNCGFTCQHVNLTFFVYHYWPILSNDVFVHYWDETRTILINVNVLLSVQINQKMCDWHATIDCLMRIARMLNITKIALSTISSSINAIDNLIIVVYHRSLSILIDLGDQWGKQSSNGSIQAKNL